MVSKKERTKIGILNEILLVIQNYSRNLNIAHLFHITVFNQFLLFAQATFFHAIETRNTFQAFLQLIKPTPNFNFYPQINLILGLFYIIITLYKYKASN